MMEFVLQYGLFVAKTATIVVAAGVLVALVAGLSRRGRQPDRLQVTRLNDHYRSLKQALEASILPRKHFKVEEKARRQERKALRKRSAEEAEKSRRVFVINFRGDIRASAVAALREEVTALLTIARAEDEVVLRLENAGGLVHDHGLAASQLERIRSRGIPLTVAVDKIAASGGYMMACVGDKILAAPFALLGSIGVLAQIPNFHRLLKKKDIDVEILTAGEYKRTLSMFGENTEKGREKFISELEDVHALFKDFVSEHRPVVDTEKVATGEAWYGKRALEQKLVDELKTSDEYIIDKCEDSDVFQVKYVEHHNRVEKLLDRMTYAWSRVNGVDFMQRNQGPFTY